MSDLVKRLRQGETFHTKVSHDWEPYETVERHRPPPKIQLEAADRIEQLEAALTKIADFAPGNGDVCEIIAQTARHALYPELAPDVPSNQEHEWEK